MNDLSAALGYRLILLNITQVALDQHVSIQEHTLSSIPLCTDKSFWDIEAAARRERATPRLRIAVIVVVCSVCLGDTSQCAERQVFVVHFSCPSVTEWTS